MRPTRIITAACAFGLISAAALPAFALHKGWMLQHAGGDCFFTSYAPTGQGHGAALSLNNANPDTDRFVVCPVQLAGRWGSYNDDGSIGHPPRLWGRGGLAAVDIDHQYAGQIFDCMLRAQFTGSTSTYYSSLASTTVAGTKTLAVAGNNWGGTMEAQQAKELRSLDFDCRIPKTKLEPTYAESRILGYRVKMCSGLTGECQADDGPAQSCDDVPGVGCTATVGDWAFVQTSGFECEVGISGYDMGDVKRSYSGITNTNPYVDGQQNAVFCPLKPPVDDSGRHSRAIEDVKVYYSNAFGVSVPSCVVQWSVLNGSTVEEKQSVSLVRELNANIVGTSGTIQFGLRETAVGVFCWLNPGQTLRGVTARMSLGSVTGGT